MSYYIYEHLRNDTKMPFYIGKGNGKRAFATINRNVLWHKIISESNGFSVNILIDEIDEEFALLAEREAIDVYKKRNIFLVNLTSGGQGVSGLKHSEQTKLKFSKIHKGKTVSFEVRKKISEGMKGINVGRPISDVQKKQISKTLTGRKASLESIEKMRISQKLRRLKEKTENA